MSKYKILIIEDDDDIRTSIKMLLQSENFEIIEASNGNIGVEKFNDSINLIILDIMMPGISGLEVCEIIRRESIVPILFLTAKASESDKLLGLMSGGDDYLTKPFSYAELFARVNSLIRRHYYYDKKYKTNHSGANEVGEPKQEYTCLSYLKINKYDNEVYIRNKAVNLTYLEYQILLLLASNPKKIFSIQNIYESIWNEPYFTSSSNTVMVHIRNIRAKIELDNKKPEIIATVWGKGYKIGKKYADKES